MKAKVLNRELRRGRARAFHEHRGPLVEQLAKVFAKEGAEAARRFEAKANDHLVASAPTPEAAMVAVYPDPAQAVALAQDGGEPAGILHVTLAFLGEIDPDTASRAAAVASLVASQMPALEGVVGGLASFGTDPNAVEPRYPSLALPDVPGLAELRAAVCEALEAAGIEYAENHGWTPHLTLAYLPEPTMPPAGLLGRPLSFDRLSVTRGDVARDFVFGSPLLAAGDKHPPNWTPPHPDEVVDVKKLAANLRGKTDPVRLAVAKEVMGGALSKVGIDFDATNPLVSGVLSKTGAKVTDIADTTRLNIMRSIREAYEQGLSIPDTAALIRAGMEAAGEYRSEMIARTEMVGVANGGSIAAAEIVGEAAGVEYWKRWLTADGADFPRHEDYDGLDGQTVPLDAMFDVAGYQLEYPGDPGGPPEEVINCRCAVAMIEATGSAEPNPDAEGEVVASAADAPPVALPSVEAPIETGGDVPELAEVTVSRLEAVRNALVAAGVPEPKRAPIAGSYELTQGPVSLLAFLRAAEAVGATEMVSERWPCDSTSLGEGAAFQENGPMGAMGVFKLSADAVGFVDLSHGTARVHVAAKSREKIGEALAAFRVRFPFAAPPVDDLVPINFWSYGMFGPQSHTRRVAVAPWAEVEGNYTAGVRDELAALMGEDFKPGEGGQLLLWHGPPGTGKTWALRALASEWRSWADLQYIADPDKFFGDHADYMMEVLLRESFADFGTEDVPAEQRWQVLVLEDTGEMLSADAKDRSGQGLSRLLNVVDGLIGQGLQILVLVTTNEELEVLHPAVSREGRCAAQTLFAPLSAEEATVWLGTETAEGGTLAELYARGRKEEAVDPAAELAEEAPTVELVLGETEDGDLAAVTREGAVVAELVADAGLAEPAVAPIVPDEPLNAAQLRWEGVLVMEGTLTADGRYIEPGATTWRTLPLTLMAQLETAEGHMGARVAGRIDEIWRGAADPFGKIPIYGRGVFDDGEFGQDVGRMVAEKVLTGNSVDLAVLQVELAYKDDFDENGHRKEAVDEGDSAEEPDLLEAMFGADLVIVFTECVIGASTVCAFPAFAEAEIALAASGGFCFQAKQQHGMVVTRVGGAPVSSGELLVPTAELAAIAAEAVESVTASAAGLAPVVPPGEWFLDPELTEATPLTVTEDGRVFGHLAEWDTCHIGIPGVCTTAPHSNTNYAYFHLGEIEVEGGERVACGKITLGTGHAAKHLGRVAASDHYDHSGAAVADVIVGEDDFGPWVAGALRPDVDAERVRELTAATLSGDWRNVAGNLELVAVLAVNVPGFPVPRVRAEIVASGSEAHVTALTAAGILGDAPPELSPDDQAMLAALGARASGLDALVELASRAA